MAPVTIYSTKVCPYCRAAKELLAKKGAPFTEIDLTDDPDGRAQLRQRTGRTSVPQIFIGETHVGGFDDLRALDQQGKLDPLLAGH